MVVPVQPGQRGAILACASQATERPIWSTSLPRVVRRPEANVSPVQAEPSTGWLLTTMVKAD